jgi:signal transduction histidine kinase
VIGGLQQAVQQDIASDLPLLQLDPARMRLLLRNLLDNALRHSAEASQAPMLRITATEQGSVELSVRDFGAGVPPEQLPNLAQAFYRPDAARTRDDGGVGLGLYLCKLVALAHGGTFAIANASPGLVITVTVPPSIPGNPT